MALSLLTTFCESEGALHTREGVPDGASALGFGGGGFDVLQYVHEKHAIPGRAHGTTVAPCASMHIIAYINI